MDGELQYPPGCLYYIYIYIYIYIYLYMYHFHTSDQRKASAHISHIALTQNVNALLPVHISC